MYCFVLLLFVARADFAVIGDWGGHRGSVAQRRVAAVMEAQRPDFVISTGDNFYPTGIKHAHDARVDRLWRDMYKTRPWLPVLGNHDYLGNASAQLAIPDWHMPERYFSWSHGDTDFWFLDTTPWMPFNYVEEQHKLRGDISDASRSDFAAQRARVPEQIAWLRASVSQSTAKKKFVVGHHPLWTYGYHRFANHTRLADVLLDLHRRYALTAYLCGHDHSLQHIRREGLDQLLSGAGSSSFEVFDGPGLLYKSSVMDHGFLMVHDNGTATYFASDGQVLHRSGQFVGSLDRRGHRECDSAAPWSVKGCR